MDWLRENWFPLIICLAAVAIVGEMIAVKLGDRYQKKLLNESDDIDKAIGGK